MEGVVQSGRTTACIYRVHIVVANLPDDRPGYGNRGRLLVHKPFHARFDLCPTCRGDQPELCCCGNGVETSCQSRSSRRQSRRLVSDGYDTLASVRLADPVRNLHVLDPDQSLDNRPDALASHACNPTMARVPSRTAENANSSRRDEQVNDPLMVSCSGSGAWPANGVGGAAWITSPCPGFRFPVLCSAVLLDWGAVGYPGYDIAHVASLC